MNATEQLILLDESRLNEAAELFKSAFAGAPWNDDWSDGGQLKKYIREVSGSFNALNYGLLADGKLVAISLGGIRHWWEDANYNIEEFCVSPDLQGNGVGSRFMKMIEADVKKRGLSGIFLQTDSDKPSFRFYKKNGFCELEFPRRADKMTPLTAICADTACEHKDIKICAYCGFMHKNLNFLCMT